MTQIRPICEKDRKEIEKQVVMRWGGRSMAIHGELIDVTNLPGFLAFENTQLVGMLTYRESSEGIEIISLDSFIRTSWYWLGLAKSNRASHRGTEFGASLFDNNE